MNVVTVSSKFEVIIPSAARRCLRLRPGSKPVVVAFNGSVHLLPLQPAAALRGITRGVETAVSRELDRAV